MIGEPLVLAGCLHNLGHKKVSTSRVDSNILTPDSAVVSFTVCKDELNPEKWEEVIKAPVKATQHLWGRDQLACATLGQSFPTFEDQGTS